MKLKIYGSIGSNDVPVKSLGKDHRVRRVIELRGDTLYLRLRGRQYRRCRDPPASRRLGIGFYCNAGLFTREERFSQGRTPERQR